MDSQELAKQGSQMDKVIDDLEEVIETTRKERDFLRARLDNANQRLARAEKAKRFLTGEPAPQGKPRGPYKKFTAGGEAKGVSEERVELVERTIREYIAEHDTDEFRQVDIRAITGMTSSTTATSFERLRQRGIIRFARQDGNNKWFRLTRQAMNGGAPDEPEADE